MEKLNELVEQAKEMAVLHGPVWSSALCESGCDGQAIKHHAIISDSKNDFVIDTGSDTNEASWLCDYLELCSPANILAIAEAFRALEKQRDALAAENSALKDSVALLLEDARRVLQVEPNAGTESRINTALSLLSRAVKDGE